MPTFAEIQEEISSMLSIPDDELDEDQKKAMDAYLDELASQEAAKVDSFAQFIKLQSDRVDSLKKESRRLAERAKSAENRIAWLKAYYADQMISRGLKKISGDIYALSLRKTLSVDIQKDLDLLTLPENYLRRKEIIEADKETIKESLKDGLPVPGCKLVEKMNLQIR